MKKLMMVLIAMTFVGAIGACTKSEDSKTASSSASTDSDSMKKSAEAEAAEEAIAKEKKSGKRSVASVKKTKKPNAESIFVVQVGTFKIEENAKKITDKLKSSGLPVFQKKIERGDGVVLYAVRFEPTPNRVEAEKFVSSVKSATGESPLILSVGN